MAKEGKRHTKDPNRVYERGRVYPEGQRKPFNPLRAPNAFAAGAVLCFFLLHAFLGTYAILSGWRGELAWVIWIGVAVIGFHVIMSVATTYSMFTDMVRVASPGKRRHQWFKWFTGAVIVACVAWHASGAQQLLDAPATLGAVAAIAAIAAFSWHVWVGAKSLSHDLRVSPGFRTPVRVVSITLAVVLSIALVVNVLVVG